MNIISCRTKQNSISKKMKPIEVWMTEKDVKTKLLECMKLLYPLKLK